MKDATPHPPSRRQNALNAISPKAQRPSDAAERGAAMPKEVDVTALCISPAARQLGKRLLSLLYHQGLMTTWTLSLATKTFLDVEVENKHLSGLQIGKNVISFGIACMYENIFPLLYFSFELYRFYISHL